jgi:RNA polymerase sigma factor (sigma-70 family)
VKRLTDQQLLCEYTAQRSETAFEELVRRHIDFIYSAALRMIPDAHLAEDVTQSVFLELAKNAAQCTNHPVLSGWLHRTTRNIAAQTVRTNVRRIAREQEAVAMKNLVPEDPQSDWKEIAPLLDDAIGHLPDQDREALLLRYFERKSAGEMALTLGVSSEAAQKRVSRAVHRVRELLVKRGVAVREAGLMTALTTNCVQAAPQALATSITAAAALTTTSLASSITTTIAMTTLQKTLIAVSLAIVGTIGIHQMNKASSARDALKSIQNTQAQEIANLSRERESAVRQSTALAAQNEKLGSNGKELLQLRSEVGILRQQIKASEQLRSQNSGANANVTKDPPKETQTFPRESWAFAGYETPENTFQSLAWAIKSGNSNICAECVTPYLLSRYRALLSPGTDVFQEDGFEGFSPSTKSYWIVNRQTNADEMTLFIYRNDEFGNSSGHTVFEKSINGKWKIGHISERTKY